MARAAMVLAAAAAVGAAQAAAPAGTLVVNSLDKYPGYEGDIAVVVDTPLEIAFPAEGGFEIFGTLSGLETSTGGGIHVHSSATCDGTGGAGPHYWEGSSDVDPWANTKWASDENGIATLEITGTNYSQAAIDATLGRVMVVHANDGTKVACGKVELRAAEDVFSGTLAPYFDIVAADYPAQAKMEAYPGLAPEITFPTGMVTLTVENVLQFALESLEPETTYTVHIHEGYTCTTSGSHWYQVGNTTVDPWADSSFTTDAEGKFVGEIDVDALGENVYDFADNVNHAIVVHDTSSRIGCGVLSYAPAGEGFVSAFTVGEEITVAGWVNNLVHTGELGAHVHVGASCSEANGGHFLAGDIDPWASHKISVNTVTQGGNELSRGYFAFTTDLLEFESLANRTYTVHDAAGRRILCAEFAFQQGPTEAPSTSPTASPTVSGASGLAPAVFAVALAARLFA